MKMSAVSMNRTLRPLLLLISVLLINSFAAQAQAALVNGIVTGFNLGRMVARGDFAEKNVVATTYRGQQYPLKRTPAGQLSGQAADQIALLEAQLDQCHAALLADSAGVVCPPNRQATIQATQAIITKARPAWNQKMYRTELAFYVAEDARRQQVAGGAPPTK